MEIVGGNRIDFQPKKCHLDFELTHKRIGFWPELLCAVLIQELFDLGAVYALTQELHILAGKVNINRLYIFFKMFQCRRAWNWQQ